MVLLGSVPSTVVSFWSGSSAEIFRNTLPVSETIEPMLLSAIPDCSVDAATAQGQEIVQELRNHVAKEIGPIAKPRSILVVPELPKTRSGKIMRRLLRDVAENREVGDQTTLADTNVMDLIKEGMSKPSASSED